MNLLCVECVEPVRVLLLLLLLLPGRDCASEVGHLRLERRHLGLSEVSDCRVISRRARFFDRRLGSVAGGGSSGASGELLLRPRLERGEPSLEREHSRGEARAKPPATAARAPPNIP